MPRKPQSPPLPPPYKIAAKQTWIGEVDAATEAATARQHVPDFVLAWYLRE